MTRTPKAPAKTGATLEQVAFLAQAIHDTIAQAARTQEALDSLAPDMPSDQRAQIAQGIAIACQVQYLGDLAGLGDQDTLQDLTQSMPALVQKLTTDYLGPLVAMAETIGDLSQQIAAATKSEG